VTDHGAISRHQWISNISGFPFVTSFATRYIWFTYIRFFVCTQKISLAPATRNLHLLGKVLNLKFVSWFPNFHEVCFVTYCNHIFC
jgi:hypothetical protein